MFYGTKPNLHNLPEFGSKVWVHTTSGSKLDGRLVVGRWVGFDEESSGHRIYSPDTRTVSVQRSVKFNSGDVDLYLPRIAPSGGDKKSTKEKSAKLPEQAPINQTPIKSFDQRNDPVDPLGESFERLPVVEGRPKCVQQESATIRRLCAGKGVMSDLPREHGQLPTGIQEGTGLEKERDELGSAAAAVAIVNSEIDEVEPSYEEAHSRSDWLKWKEAIDVELKNLEDAKTWEVVERPDGINVVDSKWVFVRGPNDDFGRPDR